MKYTEINDWPKKAMETGVGGCAKADARSAQIMNSDFMPIVWLG